MTRYQYGAQVHIEKEILGILADGDYSLCIQKFLDDQPGMPKPIANVVTASVAAHEYSSVITFKWNNTYAIRATNRLGSEEGRRAGETKSRILPIAREQSLLLSTWASYQTVHYSGAPPNGFAFQPSPQISHPGASCVVYLTDFSSPVSQSIAPFYMSPRPVIGGSARHLVPIDQVVVFFDQGYQSNCTEIYTGIRTLPDFVTLSDQTPKKAVKFLNDKTWKEVPWDILYE